MRNELLRLRPPLSSRLLMPTVNTTQDASKKRKRDALAAADTIASYMQSMLLRYPDAPVFVMGDFNSCTLATVLPSFHQYIHVPTRNNKTIDLCYGNIPSAYSARAHPPLGRADDNVINLIPAYRQLLKRVKLTKVKVRQWT
ncbi:hypothetical protein NP493_1723g00011 [Ridgeia piscesae]|uniref:Endonuclease/exonuclease/phosphatase domain-containing protein n=1 Tax=Ridgeia piscesae TaxID=27915 RepID=A0AAD9N790_RIDPI|nr:hypothetical protein NP493_1723g00011 [Ridgeia piscesae]